MRNTLDTPSILRVYGVSTLQASEHHWLWMQEVRVHTSENRHEKDGTRNHGHVHPFYVDWGTKPRTRYVPGTWYRGLIDHTWYHTSIPGTEYIVTSDTTCNTNGSECNKLECLRAKTGTRKTTRNSFFSLRPPLLTDRGTHFSRADISMFDTRYQVFRDFR